MSGRGRGRGLGVGRGRGPGRGLGPADPGNWNPAHQSLDPPALLSSFYAPASVQSAYPNDHPLWQDVAYLAYSRAQGPPAAQVQQRPPAAAPLPVRQPQPAPQPTAPQAVPAGSPVPPRDARPWSSEEDALIIEMHAARSANRETPLTYASIAASTGRSANAVKCRWQNKLKAEAVGI